ncbi:MAG: hypothetical protein LQ340_007320 [Diploschistes diacapsis]|nr:MAG: hypothetical protein LQ340_007320 [Diploschistes diacapsis]
MEIEPESLSDSDPRTSSLRTDPESRFSTLLSFYRSELGNKNPSNPLLSPAGDIDFDSPSSLQRIMALYTDKIPLVKKSSTKATSMRESVDPSDGLFAVDGAAEEAAIANLREQGIGCTTNMEQRMEQSHNPRFVSDLRPVPTLLRTKRSRRCRACRHILVKPEVKVQSTRYRIKLVAMSYVPSISLKPLSTANASAFEFTAMPPSRPLQLLLCLKNPMFDPVKVTLATPAQTPGRFGSRVTILCPQFEIGANTDVWDEALGEGKRSSRVMLKGGRLEENNETKVAEAGKTWEKGRNWTTVVLEVVCAKIECPDEELEEDEDVLEIPLFVRLEYEADASGDAGGSATGKEKREKRELAYWAVLGVGRIARSPLAATA